MEKRTHSCGALSSDDAGQQVTLMGWVRTRRNHGQLVFLDLWDREGVTQVVADPGTSASAHAVAADLRDESVVAVQGTVKKRLPHTQNPALATGEIEVAAKQIDVLNPAAPLPYPVADASTVDESIRLRHRYLDLRRAPMQRPLHLRHRLIRGLRDALDARGFLEVETPLLTRSTPEGARDYLVPSRVHPGSFYALPQSPQQMKQLLMVAGVDRYYQVARCFRDEDLRADRQPEFTQLDLEMSFVDQEDVLALVEAMVAEAIGAAAPDKRLETPFPRLTYDQALARYGTDKPDLRTDRSDPGALSFAWITDFPLFQWDAEAQRWAAEHHPFTSPKPEDLPLLASDPGAARASCYDLVCNGWELGSGSIRIHRRALQEQVLDLLGYTPAAAEASFGHLLEALDYGAPPHGGIALGIDRLVAILAGCDTIRDVIAFPKTRQAIDPTMRAPAPVAPDQLDTIHIQATVPQDEVVFAERRGI